MMSGSGWYSIQPPATSERPERAMCEAWHGSCIGCWHGLKFATKVNHGNIPATFTAEEKGIQAREKFEQQERAAGIRTVIGSK